MYAIIAGITRLVIGIILAVVINDHSRGVN
jgi:ABC-type sugar transport system permease subunit